MALMNRLKGYLDLARTVYRLPRIHLRTWGEGVPRELYGVFTRRHPRLKVVGFKQIGVALLPMPADLEAYLGGSEHQYLRRMRNRSLREGYSCRRFRAEDHFEEIMAIHLSMDARQGKPMTEIYTDPQLVQTFIQEHPEPLGVFTREGTLCAYFVTDLIGDVWYLRRLIGHGEHLSHGIMYLLVSTLIDEMCAHRREHGFPEWGMYDTYFGAHEGLKFFKDHLGFAPYNVRWTWTPQRPDGMKGKR
jgi:hypothetical protein